MEVDDEYSMLQNLPVEMFRHICSFVDTSTLVHGLQLACKKFREILQYDFYWQVRMRNTWPYARYVIVPPDPNDQCFWKASCLVHVNTLSFWTRQRFQKTMARIDDGVGSPRCTPRITEGLLLANKGRILICGGEDQSLIFANLNTQVDDGNNLLRRMPHHACLWDFTTPDDKTIFSITGDNVLRSWDLSDSAILPNRQIEVNRIQSMLVIASCPGTNTIVTGTYRGTVLLFDQRAGDAPVTQYRPRDDIIIRVAMNSNYILSASRGPLPLVVWDKRAGKILKKFKTTELHNVSSLLMQEGLSYVGTNEGTLHLLDSKNDFGIVKSFPKVHGGCIKSVRYAPSCLITASEDGTVRVVSLTDPPKVYQRFKIRNLINNMDYSNGTVAVTTGSYINFWQPKKDN